MTFWTVVALLLAYNVYKDNKDTIREHLEKKKEEKEKNKKSPKKVEKGSIIPKRISVNIGDEINFWADGNDYPKKGIVIDAGTGGVYVLVGSMFTVSNRIETAYVQYNNFERTGRHVNLGWVFGDDDDVLWEGDSRDDI